MILRRLDACRYYLVLLSCLAGACDADVPPDGGVGPGEPPVERGTGRFWLVTDEPGQQRPPTSDPMVLENVEGVVSAVEDGPAAPPAGGRVFRSGGGASQVLTIRTGAGRTWRLGYHVEIGKPSRNVTPDLKALVGQEVRLLARMIDHPLAAAAGFVLFDGRGARFALDDYGLLRPNDVPGLTVQNGRVVQTTSGGCFDMEIHMSQVFVGDQPVDVPPNGVERVTIQGTNYTAVNLFSQSAAGERRCTDTPRDVRAWALWREVD
jgi:hypothetical protein